MMRKFTLFLSVAIVLAMVIGGCAAPAATTGTTATEPAATEPAAAEAAPAGPFEPMSLGGPRL